MFLLLMRLRWPLFGEGFEMWSYSLSKLPLLLYRIVLLMCQGLVRLIHLRYLGLL